MHLALGEWVLQQALTRGDTIVMRQIAERTWFDTVSGIASIVISLALLALAIGLLPAAWNFRKSYKKLNEMLDKVYGDVNPIMRHASTIADNVNYVTTAVRVDVQQVSRTVATANERLQEAVRVAERRLNEFNALMDVVQGEAEGVFVNAASTLRGMREGALAFRTAAFEDAEGHAHHSYGAERADAFADGADAYTFDFGDLSDGEIGERAAGDESGERPRIRPRPGDGR